MFITVKNTILNTNNVLFIKWYDGKEHVSAPCIKVKFKDDIFTIIKFNSIDEAKEEFNRLSLYIHEKCNKNLSEKLNICLSKDIDIDEIANKLATNLRKSNICLR